MSPIRVPRSHARARQGPAGVPPLPVHRTSDGTMVSCWRPTLWQRLRLLVTGRVWVMQMTFSHTSPADRRADRSHLRSPHLTGNRVVRITQSHSPAGPATARADARAPCAGDRRSALVRRAQTTDENHRNWQPPTCSARRRRTASEVRRVLQTGAVMKLRTTLPLWRGQRQRR